MTIWSWLFVVVTDFSSSNWCWVIEAMLLIRFERRRQRLHRTGLLVHLGVGEDDHLLDNDHILDITMSHR